VLGLRLAQHLTSGPARRGPAADQPEHDQHHDAEEESRARQVRPVRHQVRLRVLGDQPGGHEEQAGHQQHGTQDGRRDDYPRPSGRGLIRAHCSTIALRYVSRKLYEQERW
jgi:hypothetical protein